MSIPSKPKGLSGAQVARTAEFVSYQDGAVVSREIVKKPTGNVTLFAFDEDQGLSEHTAPFDALVQVLEGEAEIMIAGQSHRVQGGEMILAGRSDPRAQGRQTVQDDAHDDPVVNELRYACRAATAAPAKSRIVSPSSRSTCWTIAVPMRFSRPLHLS